MSGEFNDHQRQSFRNARPIGGGELPDGDYVGTLESVEAAQMGFKKEMKLMLRYSVISPTEHAGTTYTQFLSLDNVNTYGLLKAVLRKFHIEPDEIELEEVDFEMTKRVGWTINFSLKTKGEYQNPYVKAVFEPTPNKMELPPPQEDREAPPPSEDDIPF